MSKIFVPVNQPKSKSGKKAAAPAQPLTYEGPAAGAQQKGRGPAILAEFLPQHQFQESHALTINASPEETFSALRSLDFSRSWIIRLLFGLRMASALFAREGGRGGKLGYSFKDLEKFGFVKLAERSNKHIVYGLVGKFWEPDGGIHKIASQEFGKFHDPQMAKLTWSFHVVEHEKGSKLSTETRVKCMGDPAMWRFGTYWTMIRPFSGMVRMEMLKAVRDKVEGGGGAR